ncbi:MAG: hypothetical protein JRI23_12880 [Deltaproteobacteria bacterium]|jgi:hypothetical protein|nr:hypothetical protein [Deltaproteobacteria bacterium]MBW2532612.1 hypothetical protein [Deltaproteobacteria bacterium]
MYRRLLDPLALLLVALVPACATGALHDPEEEEGGPTTDSDGQGAPQKPDDGSEPGQGEQTAPEGDLCRNWTDDDGDGSIDEGCPCQPGPSLACTSSCGAGVQTCEDGTWSSCEGELVEVDIDAGGDCAWIYCPPEAPYPVGCQLDFVGNSPSGCVAYEPGSTGVYLQEGKACDAGEVTGTLSCSACPGDGPDAANCPVNKPDPSYVEEYQDCPGDQT